MTVSLTRDGAPDRRFTFSMADHPLLTPLLAYTAIAGIVSEHERDIGPATYAVRGRASIAGHAAVEFDDVFAGDQPGIAVASAVAMPLSALLTNDLGTDPASSRSTSTSTAPSASAARPSTASGSTRPRSSRGQSVPVKILLTPWRGDAGRPHRSTWRSRGTPSGPLTLVVADGVRFAQWEQREQRATLRPASVDQMVKVLNESRRGNRIYVRLVGRDTGAVVNGEVMPVAALVGAERHAGRPRRRGQPAGSDVRARRLGDPDGSRGRGPAGR